MQEPDAVTWASGASDAVAAAAAAAVAAAAAGAGACSGADTVVKGIAAVAARGLGGRKQA